MPSAACSSCGTTIDLANHTWFAKVDGWRKRGKGAVLSQRSTGKLACRSCFNRGIEQLELFEEVDSG